MGSDLDPELSLANDLGVWRGPGPCRGALGWFWRRGGFGPTKCQLRPCAVALSTSVLTHIPLPRSYPPHPCTPCRPGYASHRREDDVSCCSCC